MRQFKQMHTANGNVYWEVHEFAPELLIIGASVSCISDIGKGMKGYYVFTVLPPVLQEELPKYDPRTEPTSEQLDENFTKT